MTSRPLLLSALLTCAALSTACQSAHPAPTTLPAAHQEFLDQRYLFDLLRYLYRWHLDEDELEKALSKPDLVCWIKTLHPKLDADDHSQLAELFFPDLDLIVRLKKADYAIPELNLAVHNDHFKITEVDREDLPAHAPADCSIIHIPVSQLRDDLFTARKQRQFPDAALIERMRAAAREEAQNDPRYQNLPAADKLVYIAPLSPISNECWAFWQAEHVLFYFSSDIDLTNPAVWQHEKLDVQIFDLDDQVIVAPSEAPGSNRFLTRNEVGRALYNCTILGQPLTLTQPTPAK